MLTLRGKIVLFWIVALALILAACGLSGAPPDTGNRQTPTVPAGAENSLANTEWILESYGPPGAEIPVVAGSTVMLKFEASDQVGGSAGCNSYGGQYQVDGKLISFSELVQTLMACADERVMEQEAQYLAALETAGQFELSGDRLAITYDGGQGVLNFVRATGTTTASAPGGQTPVETASPAPPDTGASPTEGAETTASSEPAEEHPYLDDRSTPTGLIRSYFNAINRQEYLRAYSYWRDPDGAAGPFEQFQAGYQDTVAVDLTLGQVGGDAGAGQLYYSVPALLEAETTDSGTQTYAACYILELSQPAIQAAPPFMPLGIEMGRAEPLEDDANPAQALAAACSGPDFPSGNPIDPPPTTDPGDISADNYLDDRSGPVEVLRSYFNAINRKEYVRAYAYWENTGAGSQVGTYEHFQSGYAETESVQLTTGQVSGDAGAGQRYYSVPVVLKAQTTGGDIQTFAGCYNLHLANPSIQTEPPFQPLAILSADVEQAENGADTAALLSQDCAP